MAAKDFTPIGSRFNRLEVIGAPFKDKFYIWKVLCRCDCGSESTPSCRQLVIGQSKSCGCLQRENALRNVEKLTRHGMTGTPTFTSWSKMVHRCTVPTGHAYADYGGRGIKVCDRWIESFENFFADMGERPDGMTLDRYPDVNGNYEPGNCRWATQHEQNNNRRSNVYLEFDGRRMTLSQWSREIGISKTELSRRYHRGIPVDQILSPNRK